MLMLSACGDDGATTAAPGPGGEAPTPTTDGGELTPGATDEVTRLWIRPDLVDCEGEAPQRCMQVAESENGEFEFFYDDIEGFAFNEGTSYVIDVTIERVPDPPADGSSLDYTLVEVVEETEVVD